nr:TetR/AcrR family transcriptional regulator [uncultured Cohaesibacter sp.]
MKKSPSALPKGEETAEKILDAAMKAIATKGCGAVTLREIAKEAGVVLSQLNYYYGNKDGLFVAVLKRMQENYITELEGRLKKGVSLQDHTRELIAFNRSLLLEEPEIYRNFLEFSNFAMSSPDFLPFVERFIADISDMIEERLYRSSAKDQSDHSAAVMTRFILSASFGISLQHFLAPDDKSILSGFEMLKAAIPNLNASNSE